MDNSSRGLFVDSCLSHARLTTKSARSLRGDFAREVTMPILKVITSVFLIREIAHENRYLFLFQV